MRIRPAILLCCLMLAGLFKAGLHAQTDTAWSFLVAGHAYGAHDGENQGLHPPFLEGLRAGHDSLLSFMVFAGDIVNHSTAESWQQVAMELDSFNLRSYYVMGNHDDDEVGEAVFLEKHGGSYYSFRRQSELCIVLNSTEADRAISPVQLDFLKEELQNTGDSTSIIFIFMHEIIWNSHEKYADVRANSRSRYDKMQYFSNYWEEVHPLLESYPHLNFYLIGGDMGGNPDAMSAFYDRWDHVHLLATGMGEVEDENYLLVRVKENKEVGLELVALDPAMKLPALEFFSVPTAPGEISGPEEVRAGSTNNMYAIEEMAYVDQYFWELPEGMIGEGSTSRISLSVDSSFREGVLRVSAIRDGFGRGPASEMNIMARDPYLGFSTPDFTGKKLGLRPVPGGMLVEAANCSGKNLSLLICDGLGRVLRKTQIRADSNEFRMRYGTEDLPERMIFVRLSTGELQATLILSASPR